MDILNILINVLSTVYIEHFYNNRNGPLFYATSRHVAQHRPTGSETTPCTLRSRKQQIWLRTALCRGWCRRI